MSLEAATEWLQRFGYAEDCISPTGREFYRWLLNRVAALEEPK